MTEERARAMLAERGYVKLEQDEVLEQSKAAFDYLVLSRARSRTLFRLNSLISQSIRTGVMDEQQAANALRDSGWPEDRARAIAALEANAAKVARVSKAIGHLRSAYLRAEIDTTFAVNAMQSLGVVPDAIQHYIATWNIENTPRRKRRTAKQVVDNLANGDLTEPEAILRWHNLGFDGEDIRLWLIDSGRKRTKIQQAQQQLGERAARAEERQQPVAKLMRWLKSGIITVDQFRERMERYGYGRDAIERRINEVFLAAPPQNGQA
jgi:hypothetical protein